MKQQEAAHLWFRCGLIVGEIYANMKLTFSALAGSLVSCISSYRKGKGNYTRFLETGRIYKFELIHSENLSFGREHPFGSLRI